MPPDFLIHLNELTLLIQRSGSEGMAMRPTIASTEKSFAARA